MPESFGCYVTIYNLSTQLLSNVSYTMSWGKYTLTPATNLNGGTKASTALTLLGRQNIFSGSEGACTYTVGPLGGGTITFNYSCPKSGDNYGTTVNNSADLVLLQVYSLTNSSQQGMSAWGTDPTKWGQEGSVPIDGHPIAFLFVVIDPPSS